MPELTLLTVPDDRLRQKAVEVPKELDLRSAKTDFVKKMVESSGVGLAAPQVGILYRFFVMSESGKKQDAILIRNPVIVSRSESTASGLEGCLSIPGIKIPIWRHEVIEATWDDEKGIRHARKFVGWAARIFQHEYDHLDGILISNRFEEQQNALCNDGLCC